MEYTPEIIRQAQDLAAALKHLNKGLPRLHALYSAAPEMFGLLQMIGLNAMTAEEAQRRALELVEGLKS